MVVENDLTDANDGELERTERKGLANIRGIERRFRQWLTDRTVY